MKKRIKILNKEFTWSQVIAFIFTAIFIGLLNEIGKDLYAALKTYNGTGLNYLFSKIKDFLLSKIETNIISLLLIIFCSIPIFNFLYRVIFSKLIRNEKVFFDDFSSDKHVWNLNYWGTSETKQSVRIENNQLVLDAVPGIWQANGENGAFYDLTDNVLIGRKYEISCKVTSSMNCTMGFKLWVHDTQGNNSTLSPIEFQTPPSDTIKEYKVKFIPSVYNGIRIHLHCKEGQGIIFVKEVLVKKL